MLRTRCSPQGLAAVVDGALLLVEHAAEHRFPHSSALTPSNLTKCCQYFNAML